MSGFWSVRTPEHVTAHLLICMIALIMLRIIQMRIRASGLELLTPVNHHLFFHGAFVPVFVLNGFFQDSGLILDRIIRRINTNLVKKTHRSPEIIYYDVTNFYFEIGEPDEDVLDEEGSVLEKGFFSGSGGPGCCQGKSQWQWECRHHP